MARNSKAPTTEKQESDSAPDGDEIAFSIKGACKQSSLGRTTIYNAITTKELPVVKVGTRTLILRRDLLAFLQGKQRPGSTAPPA